MKASEALEYMENEIRCVQRSKFCDRDCGNCNLVKEDRPLIESYGVAISALEKQIPKKPKTLTYKLLVDSGWEYGCPNCGCAIGENKNLKFAYTEYLEPYESYCCSCGQKLDWGDAE